MQCQHRIDVQLRSMTLIHLVPRLLGGGEGRQSWRALLFEVQREYSTPRKVVAILLMINRECITV